MYIHIEVTCNMQNFIISSAVTLIIVNLYVLPLQPPRGIHNTIISGANLRTKSNVWFGEPTMSRTFYDTTTDDQFQPVSVPFTYNRQKFYKESDVAMNYYDSKLYCYNNKLSNFKQIQCT